jgi:hypothetical protein
MKAKFVCLLSCKNVSIETDAYVPLNVEVENASTKTVYWLAGNGSTSLIEIGADSQVGSLNCITLVNVRPDQIRSSSGIRQRIFPTKKGLVVFDVSGWNLDSQNFSDNFIEDFQTDFILEVGSDFVKINFAVEKDEAFQVKNDRLILGFSEDRFLISISILELDADARDLIMKFNQGS